MPAASAAALPAWRDLVRDARLREVIALALENNRDLRLAMLRVDEARAALGLQSADRWPWAAATPAPACRGT